MATFIGLIMNSKCQQTLYRISDFLEGKLVEEDTYIYVCQNKVCKMPVKSVAEALKLINK